MEFVMRVPRIQVQILQQQDYGRPLTLVRVLLLQVLIYAPILVFYQPLEQMITPLSRPQLQPLLHRIRILK